MSPPSFESGRPWNGDLMKAIKHDDELKVNDLILGHSAERAGQSYRDTLRRGLQTAAALGKTSIVQLLLDNGAEIEAAQNETSALFRAVEWGHCPVVRLLLTNGANIEVKDRCRRTVLFYAVSKAYTQIVEELLRHGVQVSVKDVDNRTVLLHIAAQKQDSRIDKHYGGFPRDSQEPNDPEGPNIVQLLLESDIDLEARDKLDRTVLHWAAATGKEKLLSSLICGAESNRAKLDARNRRNKTALHLAAENDHPEIARILLEQGADCNATSDGAWTALHIAAENGHLDILKLLSHHGAKLNAETTNGMTPLHWAATHGHVETVKDLLGQPGIKRHPKDSLGYTPLMRAAQHRHTAITHLLSSSYDGKDLSDVARQACTKYKATVTDFFPHKAERRKFAVFNKPTMFDLLYGIEPPKDAQQKPEERKPLWTTMMESTKAKPAFRWVHLPANNMAWAEALITKYFTERGLEDVDGFKALAKSMSDQHRGKTDHSQFMRPSCQSLPSSPRLPRFKNASDESGKRIDVTDSKRSKVVDKANKDLSDEPRRVRSVDKETNGNRNANSPTKPTKKLKKNIDGSVKPTTPPSPAQARPSDSHFTDRILDKGFEREKPQRSARLSNGSNLVEPDPGIKRSTTDKSNPDKAAKSFTDSYNIVLFMPYLHYETDKSRLQMSETINTAFARRRAIKESQAARAAALTMEEMLEKKILLNETSLHPRRTLNQFYFPAISSDTSSQAATIRSDIDPVKDQESSKRRKLSVADDKKKPKEPRAEDDPHSAAEELPKEQALIHAYLLNAPPLHPRRTLDQFYYSALNTEARDQDQVVYRYCYKHKMDPKIFMVDQLWLWILGKDLIITSFPQRWHQPRNDPFDVLDGIIEDMFQPRVESVFDLASRITGRCSGMFYRDWHDDDYHFLDMFEHSIGDLESKEPKLVSDFDKSAKQAKDWFDSQNRTEKYPKFDDYFMNIGEEMAVLAEIKDIRNELSMISSVLTHQDSCLKDLNQAINWRQPTLPEGKKEELGLTFEEQRKNIEGYVANIERMDQEARDLYNSVNPLLDLKQKYAGVFEARYARLQATTAVRQGHTIMVFTIVTIIFLPMSFIAAFFAVNIEEFPHGVTGSLRLNYVSKYTFGIGLAISVPLIVGALTVDNLLRFYNRMITPVLPASSSTTIKELPEARKWWTCLWHSTLPEKNSLQNQDWNYKLPGKTPTVLFKTTSGRDTSEGAPTVASGPRSRVSALLDQGTFFGRGPLPEKETRKVGLVSRKPQVGADLEKGEG